MLALVAAHTTPLPDPPAPALQVGATPRALRAGAAFAVRGGVSLGPATTVKLLANPYPYAGFTTVASAALPAGRTGRTFSFRVVLDRTTRYRVTATGAAGSPDKLTVSALGRTAITSQAITLGRARVSVPVYHPRDLRWGGAGVSWAFASGGRHARFVSSPATRSKRLSPYVVKLTTTVTLPAGRYSWRACFNAPLAGALLQRRRVRSARAAATREAGRCRSDTRARQRSPAPPATSRRGPAGQRSPSSTARAGCRAFTCTGRSCPPASSRRCCWSRTCGA